MDKYGLNAHQVLSGGFQYRNLTFQHWMDDNTLIFTEYIGGGQSAAHIIDIAAGVFLAHLSIDVGRTFGPSVEFVPVVSCFPILCNISIISRSQSSHRFPVEKVIISEQAGDFIFKDWLPGTNRMLLAWFGWDSDKDGYWVTASRLLLWDVETDKLSSIAPAGVDGKYSSNGQFLAFVTKGQADLTENDSPQPYLTTSVSKEANTYLHLMDLTNEEILFSIPVVERLDTMSFPPPVYRTMMAFSPDNRYFAFETAGSLILDEKGWPIDFSESDSLLYINILDIVTRKLIVSIPIPDQYSSFTWSPESSKFIYRTVDANWSVYDLERSLEIAITQSNAEDLVYEPSWSFDGGYVEFSKYKRLSGFYPLSISYIIEIP